jgi:hypothetical protein
MDNKTNKKLKRLNSFKNKHRIDPSGKSLEFLKYIKRIQLREENSSCASTNSLIEINYYLRRWKYYTNIMVKNKKQKD